MKARLRVFQACYDKERKKTPKLEGTSTVEMIVTTVGRGSEIKVTDDIGNEAVSSCLKSIARTWIFPFKPSTDVPAKIVVSFKPPPQ